MLLISPNYHWPGSPTGAGQSIGKTPFGSDFIQEWIGADIIRTGESGRLYRQDYFTPAQHDVDRIGFRWDYEQYYPPVYPPSHYTAFLPLSYVPYRWATFIWLGISLISLPIAVWSAERIAQKNQTHDLKNLSHDGQAGTRGFHRSWLLAMLFPGLLTTITMGQKGIVFLAIAGLTWLLWTREKRFAAGLVFGLLTIKPTLVFVLPLIALVSRQFRFLIGVGLTAGLLIGWSFCWVSLDVWRDYVSVVLSAGDYQNVKGYRPDWSASLLTLTDWIFPGNKLVKLIALIAGSASLMVLVWQMASAKERDALNASQFARLIYVAMLGTALLSPHFYFYDAMLLILPIRIWLVEQPTRATLHAAVLTLFCWIAQEFQLTFPVLPIVFTGLLLDASRSRFPRLGNRRSGHTEAGLAS